ncbi:MAG: hypothetical protein AAGK74_00315 [Chloroflexota bacterium]
MPKIETSLHTRNRMYILDTAHRLFTEVTCRVESEIVDGIILLTVDAALYHDAEMTLLNNSRIVARIDVDPSMGTRLTIRCDHSMLLSAGGKYHTVFIVVGQAHMPDMATRMELAFWLKVHIEDLTTDVLVLADSLARLWDSA